MSKYNNLKYLKKTKARVDHICENCGKLILPEQEYYRETIDDKFLHSLHSKSFCSKCYEEHGESLLKIKSRKEIARKRGSTKLEDFFK